MSGSDITHLYATDEARDGWSTAKMDDEHRLGVVGHDPEVLGRHLPTIADHLDDEFAM